MKLPTLAAVILATSWTWAGCSNSPDDSNAVSIACPRPSPLPFHPMSFGFQSPNNATIAATNTRIKDEASDNLGVPGGPVANVNIANTATPAPGPLEYSGIKGRTTQDEGANLSPLAGEFVSLWYYDYAVDNWQQIARAQTDANGAYDFASTGFEAVNGAQIYSLLEADNTCTWHEDWLMPPGTEVIVLDIDGTLTADDNEFTLQIVDGSYTPVEMKAGQAMVQAWVNKGYQPIYLTARTHGFDFETRTWLQQLNFPPGPVLTAVGGLGEDAQKVIWMKRFVNDFGWKVFAAYGNHSTDAVAYASVNVPLDHTFTIGPFNGTNGTTPILDDDYSEHIVDFIAGQPDLIAE